MRWSIIKSILKNPLVKVSYIIIIILPILLEVLENLTMNSHFSQMVFNVYYSGVCILVSFLLYSLFAPYEIKSFEDSLDYTSKMLPTLKEYNPDKRKNVVLAHLDETEIRQRDEIELLYGIIKSESNPSKRKKLENRLKILIDPLYNGCSTRYLQKEWIIKDKSKYLPLVFCLLFILIGTFFALWVFVERISIVINHNFIK